MAIKDKVVIITGASSGIGEATAKLLANQGAKVVLAARREEKLKKITKDIINNGGLAEYKVTDITKKEDVQDLKDYTLQKFQNVDVLINNAGYMEQSYLYKANVEEWDKMIDSNIKGMLYAIAEILPLMREKNSGQIINMSSVLGHHTGPANVVYSATKHAILAFTEGLRLEEVSDNTNVRVSAISPGMIKTELLDNITDTDVKKKVFERKDTMGIEPSVIAKNIAFVIDQPEEYAVNELVIRPINED